LQILAVNVTGLDDGIWARNVGTGELSISLTGDVVSTSTDTSDDNYSHGIYAVNYGTNLTISTAGDVTSNDRGIYSWNDGSGALSVTSTGDVTALGADGIYADNADWSTDTRSASSATDINITVNIVTAYDEGISVNNYGTGSTTITATGQITGGSWQQDQTVKSAGIKVKNEATAKNITITAKNVEGIFHGLTANNFCSGVTEVRVSGSIIGRGERDGEGAEGIHVLGAAATVTVTSAASVIGDGEGIETTENADIVTVNGSVTGKNGTAIKLNGGADTINIGANSTITGIVDGGDGSDTVTFGVAKGAIESFSYNQSANSATVITNGLETTLKTSNSAMMQWP